MGKIKKMKNRTGRKNLADQIQDERRITDKFRLKFRDEEEEDEEFVDPKLSRKILRQARLQQEEIAEEFGTSSSNVAPTVKLDGDDEDDDISDEDNAVSGPPTDDFFDNIEINEEDERALEKFMSKNPTPRFTLADVIKGKITEKHTELLTQFSDRESVMMQDINPKVKELYQGVRDVLIKYRSGKLPKAFKIVPKLSNWEQILYITEPHRWSAAAMYQATRIFASNLKEKMAQRFYNLVLLPRVRDDIQDFKRLNFHIFQALRKALFKPAAFMKGILLPLCECGNCTLREAIIIGSVIAKNSIPMLHSAAAILKLAEMDYNGANSIFLRILFDKKYALPYRVVDAVVFHFLRFERDHRELPVLWHQAFLTFCQRYKTDISSEQKEALLKLLRSQTHPTITPEIRRELMSSKCRDVEMAEPPSAAMDF